MFKHSPRADWFRQRAENARLKAKNAGAKKEMLLRMASAYQGLADKVTEDVEAGERLLKAGLSRTKKYSVPAE
jgi:hypothetical protein